MLRAYLNGVVAELGGWSNAGTRRARAIAITLTVLIEWQPNYSKRARSTLTRRRLALEWWRAVDGTTSTLRRRRPSTRSTNRIPAEGKKTFFDPSTRLKTGKGTDRIAWHLLNDADHKSYSNESGNTYEVISIALSRYPKVKNKASINRLSNIRDFCCSGFQLFDAYRDKIVVEF